MEASLSFTTHLHNGDPLTAERGALDDCQRGWTLRPDVDGELVPFCPDCDVRECGG